MVWEEILIGFTIAGFVAVLVPPSLWEKVFLTGAHGDVPHWLIVLENAAVAPFVAAVTFIGSMGNIPLATVLNTNGVLFAGIMGFIFSDLMVPPLVMVNAKYYGWRVALYIAAVMFASIVLTAVAIQYGFSALGITPESSRRAGEVAQFALDYTFYMNAVFVVVAAVLLWLNKRHHRATDSGMDHDMNAGIGLKRIMAWLFMAVLIIGLAASFLAGG
jgi:hypothetical protein